ncbi:MAG: nucleoside hydrolase [Pirellulaceae bacterium]|nr:nucleoside hydrolase [Pirellulaceae bacterium]
MTRKVIIDCDPGIDDAVALCLALFDPRLEVVAITATPGNVSAEQASRNVQAIVEQLDPPRYPRIGAAVPPDFAPDLDACQIHGGDGLANAGFVVSTLQNQRPSDKLIVDEVRMAPDEVTIVCLGPLTNIARAFQRDPDLPSLVDRLVIMGGSVEGIGNVTACAEFNIYFAPVSARDVFQSFCSKTLVPLDVTTQIVLSLEMLDELPGDTTRVGTFLRKLLPFAFRAYRQHLGKERIHLHDVVALIATLHPELFETTEMLGDVETKGDLTTGMTVFDRRVFPPVQANLEVVTEIDTLAVMDCLIRGLTYAGRVN